MFARLLLRHKLIFSFLASSGIQTGNRDHQWKTWVCHTTDPWEVVEAVHHRPHLVPSGNRFGATSGIVSPFVAHSFPNEGALGHLSGCVSVAVQLPETSRHSKFRNPHRESLCPSKSKAEHARAPCDVICPKPCQRIPETRGPMVPQGFPCHPGLCSSPFRPAAPLLRPWPRVGAKVSYGWGWGMRSQALVASVYGCQYGPKHTVDPRSIPGSHGAIMAAAGKMTWNYFATLHRGCRVYKMHSTGVGTNHKQCLGIQ